MRYIGGVHTVNQYILRKTTTPSDIRCLLDALTSEELSTLRRILSERRRNSKSLQFVELLLDGRYRSNESVAHKFFPNSKPNTRASFYTGLRNSIHDALLKEANTQRRELYSEFRRADNWVKKKFLVTELLLQRGLDNEVEALYDAIIDKCTKYEIFDTLIEVLIRKRNRTVNRLGFSELNELQQKIEYHQKRKEVFEEARYTYHLLNTITNFTSSTITKVQYISDAAQRIEKKSLSYPSKQTFYYLTTLKAFLLEQSNDIEGVIQLLIALRLTIQSSPSINRTSNVETIEMNLAHYYLKLNQPDKAIIHCRRLNKTNEDTTFNSLLIREFEFLALFHLGETGRAHQKIKTLINQTDKDSQPFYHARRSYYYASILFLNGKHKAVHQTLEQTTALNTDRSGWNIAVRILDIMNQINWGGINHSAEAHIENLYQHILRAKKLKPITERHLMILDVLKALIKSGFSFNATLERKEHGIKLLSDDSSSYGWNMTHPELIRFDVWLRSKVLNESYHSILASSIQIIGGF